MWTKSFKDEQNETGSARAKKAVLDAQKKALSPYQYRSNMPGTDTTRKPTTGADQPLNHRVTFYLRPQAGTSATLTASALTPSTGYA